MAKYATNEFVFDLPEGLHDRTVNIFSINDQGPSAFSVVISRVPVPAQVSLDEQMAHLLQELQAKLTRFELHDQFPRKLSHLEAREARYSFQRGGQSVVQRQVAVLLSVGAADQWQMINVTGTFGEAAPPHWHREFDLYLDSFVPATSI